MAETIYLLCTVTSLSCALLLFRSYWRKRSSLLLWTLLCFIGLAINNALLFTDMVVFPNMDLSVARIVPAFLGLAALIYGLITEVSRSPFIHFFLVQHLLNHG